MQQQWWVDSEAYFDGGSANVSPVRVRRGRQGREGEGGSAQRVQWSSRWDDDVIGDPSYRIPSPTGWGNSQPLPLYSPHDPSDWESRVRVLEEHDIDHEERITNLESYEFRDY